MAGAPTTLVRDLATNVRKLREEVELTVEDLAEAAEIGVEFLVELEEAGGSVPAIGVILRLAGALKRRPSDFVSGVEWVPYQLSIGKGRFEVVEDAQLVAEIASLKEARSEPTAGQGPTRPIGAGDLM